MATPKVQKRKVSKRPDPAKESNAKQCQLDAFDVQHLFAEDPLKCVSSRDAQRVLRALQFPYRYWHKTQTEALTTSTFWDDLSQYLQNELEDGAIAHRFADFLVGYLLVTENETSSRALRRLRPLIGSTSTSRPQRRESLQLLLTRAMADDLSRDWTRTVACENLIPKIWSVIGITVKASSILRTERRSRRRTMRTA